MQRFTSANATAETHRFASANRLSQQFASSKLFAAMRESKTFPKAIHFTRVRVHSDSCQRDTFSHSFLSAKRFSQQFISAGCVLQRIKQLRRTDLRQQTKRPLSRPSRIVCLLRHEFYDKRAPPAFSQRRMLARYNRATFIFVYQYT